MVDLSVSPLRLKSEEVISAQMRSLVDSHCLKAVDTLDFVLAGSSTEAASYIHVWGNDIGLSFVVLVLICLHNQLHPNYIQQSTDATSINQTYGCCVVFFRFAL